jgi:hypothetical protein
MASSINASTTTGLVSTADLSGILNLQSNGTTIATVQSTGFSLPTASTINAANTFGFENRIINGGMTIDQRNAGASVSTPTTSAWTYFLDRWAYYCTSAAKYSVQQNAGAVTPPAGFTNYLGVTSLAATTVGATDVYDLRQPVEGFNVADFGWGTANAKTVTLSFWVRSSLTGTFGGTVTNSAQNRCYPFSYTISSANTWEQKSVTIAGDTSGTWLTTNGAGLFLVFGLGVGSNFLGTAGAWTGTFYVSVTGSTNVVSTNGATWYITGVQLEVGSQATSFDFRSIGQEFLLCQRYYSQTATYGSLPTTAGISGYRGAIAYATTQATGGFYFPCEMRTTPTVTPYSANGTSGVWTLPGNVNTGATTANSVGTNGFMYFIGSSYTVSTIIYGSWTASAEL